MICAFTPLAGSPAWLADLAADGIDVRQAPSGERTAAREWLHDQLEGLEGEVILHTHFTGFEVPAALEARRRAATKLIWHIHTFQPQTPAIVARAVVKYGWFGRSADAIACVSESIAAAVRHRGAARSKVAVVANGIDIERFVVPTDAERLAAREQLAIAPSAQVGLHVGWNWEAKGGPLFARSIAALRAAGLDFSGISVGGGEPATLAASELGLGDALRSVEPRPDVRGYLAAADVLLATSLGEGAPYTILEALSSGLPVIATDVSGHHLDRSPPPGLTLVAPEPGRIAAAAAEIAGRSAAERAAAAAAAHDWVAATRSLNATSDQVLGLYDRVLGRRAPAAS